MTDILGYFITVICAVIITSCYFIYTNKADKLNRNVLREELQKQKLLIEKQRLDFDSLHAWVKLLDSEKSVIKNVEMRDRVKNLETKLESLTENLNTSMLNFNTTVLRLIATFKPKKKKPLLPKEHPESIPQYRASV